MDHNRGRATSLSAVGEVVPREVEVHCTAREVEVHCNETFGPVQASIPDRTQLGPDGMSEVDKAKARKIVEAALQQYIMQEALNYDSDSDSEPPSPALNPIAASPESPRSEQNFSPASPLSPPSPTPGCFQGIVSCLRQDGSQPTQHSGVRKESALIPAVLEHAVVIEHAARDCCKSGGDAGGVQFMLKSLMTPFRRGPQPKENSKPESLKETLEELHSLEAQAKAEADAKLRATQIEIRVDAL